MTYQNPIVSGFAPDPSLCRVGDDFYLINSTFEYFPGVPIYHSRDLVHWELMGHCLNRASQLPLQDVGASGGIYAPTLRHHSGTFFMVTTNVTKGGNFIVHTSDPAGAWSEPVWVSAGGIDPSLFFDEDGTCYYTAQSDGGILQATLDPLTGKLLSEPKVIWRGTGSQHPEGPHLFKRNDTYYLTIAEGGTEYMHMQTIARSNTPWGPFEECPRNPILSHRSQWSPIHATGHSDFFTDAQGNWWVVCLAIRPVGYTPVYHLGRETFLAPVVWDEEGWPVIGIDGKIALEMDGPLPAPVPRPKESVREDFSRGRLGPEWVHLRNPDPSRYQLDGVSLTLSGTPTRLSENASPTWVGRRQRHFDCRFEAEFTPNLLKADDEAGLTVRMSERFRYEFAVRRSDVGCNELIVRRTQGSISTITARLQLEMEKVRLRIVADEKSYRFELGLDDGHALLIDSAEARAIGTEIAGGFTGVMLGLYCISPTFSAQMTIDWVDYEPLGIE